MRPKRLEEMRLTVRRIFVLQDMRPLSKTKGNRVTAYTVNYAETQSWYDLVVGNLIIHTIDAFQKFGKGV